VLPHRRIKQSTYEVAEDSRKKKKKKKKKKKTRSAAVNAHMLHTSVVLGRSFEAPRI
jgi:hypothetical protein